MSFMDRSKNASPLSRVQDWWNDPDVIAPVLQEPAKRGLCTDCGISRTSTPGDCGKACQFIAPDYPALETATHGRARNDTKPDETHFGPFRRIAKARLKSPLEGAQWTGITTRIGERLLAEKRVDAVLTMVPDRAEKWKPVPVLITAADAMRHARGMRMGYAPLLALLKPARELGMKRIAVIGIPCQVYALRALEKSLGFDAIHVIGTPCSDNTSTENFKHFLTLLSDKPETITYLEFRADYKVELRFENGRSREIPFLQLPISQLRPDFFPLTCRTCVDYTNALSDITVGYMGGEGEQWLIVRNQRGEELLNLLGDEIVLASPRSKGRREGAVKGFIANTERAAGGLPLRRMPDFIRPLVSFLMPRIGPRGLEFARTRVEMKAAETVIHLRRELPAKMKNMIPDHVWKLVAPYGLAPDGGEKKNKDDL